MGIRERGKYNILMENGWLLSSDNASAGCNGCSIVTDFWGTQICCCGAHSTSGGNLVMQWHCLKLPPCHRIAEILEKNQWKWNNGCSIDECWGFGENNIVRWWAPFFRGSCWSAEKMRFRSGEGSKCKDTSGYFYWSVLGRGMSCSLSTHNLPCKIGITDGIC